MKRRMVHERRARNHFLRKYCGWTYKKIAEMDGVCPQRAKAMVEEEERRLARHGPDNPALRDWESTPEQFWGIDDYDWARQARRHRLMAEALANDRHHQQQRGRDSQQLRDL